MHNKEYLHERSELSQSELQEIVFVILRQMEITVWRVKDIPEDAPYSDAEETRLTFDLGEGNEE